MRKVAAPLAPVGGWAGISASSPRAQPCALLWWVWVWRGEGRKLERGTPSSSFYLARSRERRGKSRRRHHRIIFLFLISPAP
jgi:hypothetical protein